MDVKTAFLNGVIEEEVYIEQPEGFDMRTWRHMYVGCIELFMGSSRNFECSRIDNYLREMGFQRSEADHNLYFLTGKVPLMLVLYVDYLFLIGDERLTGDCKLLHPNISSLLL